MQLVVSITSDRATVDADEEVTTSRWWALVVHDLDFRILIAYLGSADAVTNSID